MNKTSISKSLRIITASHIIKTFQLLQEENALVMDASVSEDTRQKAIIND